MFINLCQGPLEYTPLSIPARAIKSKRVHTPPQVQAEADECLLYGASAAPHFTMYVVRVLQGSWGSTRTGGEHQL
jgi:hypothetical protein